eukprot:250611_1
MDKTEDSKEPPSTTTLNLTGIWLQIPEPSYPGVPIQIYQNENSEDFTITPLTNSSWSNAAGSVTTKQLTFIWIGASKSTETFTLTQNDTFMSLSNGFTCQKTAEFSSNLSGV